jgi:CBS domain-containing protein
MEVREDSLALEDKRCQSRGHKSSVRNPNFAFVSAIASLRARAGEAGTVMDKWRSESDRAPRGLWYLTGFAGIHRFDTFTREERMSLLSICDPNPAAISVEGTAGEAIRMMLQQHVGAAAVLDSERRVAGIFTERDVLSRLALSGRDPEKTSVLDLMTTPVEMATEQTTEAEALATMVERHYRHLPVVDDNGRLLGMLSIRHVLEARVDQLVRELEGVRTEYIYQEDRDEM